VRERASKFIAAGAPLVAIDPDAANLRARRAYAKAGFVETRVAPTPAGDVAVMVFETSPRSKSPVSDSTERFACRQQPTCVRGEVERSEGEGQH
jgi:RimJ/RimL family protein N-acetyltransferase